MYNQIHHLHSRVALPMQKCLYYEVCVSWRCTVLFQKHCALLLVSAVQWLQPESHRVVHSKKSRVLCLLQIVQTAMMAARWHKPCWQLCEDLTHVLRAEHRQPHTVECQLMHLLSTHHRHIKTCAACFTTTAGQAFVTFMAVAVTTSCN